VNYQDTLYVLQHTCPTLFPYEENALHHLFFINGNGYRWDRGHLVDSDDGDDPEQIVARDLAWQIKRASAEVVEAAERFGRGSRWHLYRQEALDALSLPVPERWAREIEYRKFVIGSTALARQRAAVGRDLCWFIHTDGRVGSRLYPLCEYAAILHVPDNVEADWLDAAKRALAAVDSGFLRAAERDRPFLDRARARIQEV
jgi:hypothetical protein